MRRLAVAILIFGLSGSAIAGATYTNTVGLDVRLSSPRCPVYEWEHYNPAEIVGGGPMTPQQYDAALLAGQVTNMSLTIVTDDLDFGSSVMVKFYGTDLIWHDLGYLQTMSFDDSTGPLIESGVGAVDAAHLTSTTFSLSPYWLDGSLKVQVRLEGAGSSLEIETSTLSVSVGHTPAPSAVLLSGLGVWLVGWLRRRSAL